MEQARAAEEAARQPRQGQPRREVPRRPVPVRLWGVLAGLPWAFAQDEIGVQITDFIALVARVLARAVQDQRAA